MSYPPQNSILQDWVMQLPIRHQGVLLAAVRGCDGSPKENSAKPLVRCLRWAFMNPADEREVDMPSGFFQSSFSMADLKCFLSDWDHYPIHFVQHLMHGCQVIAYKHPVEATRTNFHIAYAKMVHKLHLWPEYEQAMDARLNEDRIAKYNAANAPDV